MPHSKHVGNKFENLVKNICIGYFRLGIAEIHKENDARNFKEKLRVDFIGWTKVYNKKILKNPLPVGIECKSIKGKTFNFRNIRENQIKYLKRLALVGGISMFLVEFRDLDLIYKIAITREDVLENKNFLKVFDENKSIKHDDLKQYAEVYNVVEGFDFLNTEDINNKEFQEYELF